MLKLESEILLFDGNSERVKQRFNFVNNIEIVSTYDQLTDTCTIIVPKKISFKGKDIAVGADAVFKRGDKIEVRIGYDGDLRTRFLGFILKVDLTLPITITCEDLSYLLKKKTLNKKSYSKVDTNQLLKDIIGNTCKYKVTANQTLGQFIIQDGVTALDVLKYLQENHKVYSWFRGDTLYVGLAFVNELRNNSTFDVNKNIIDNNLEFNLKEDVSIKVKATSVNQIVVNGKSKEEKITVFYPSENTEGSVRTYLAKMNIDAESLKKEAKAFYESLKFDGYSGSFTTFGAPVVEHGDGVQIINLEYPEQNNKRYLVKSVNINFGVNGYRQRIELGGLING